MKTLKTTNGYEVLLDDEDYDKLSNFSWSGCRHGNRIVVTRSSRIAGRAATYYIHREVLGLVYGDGKLVDHKNENSLDNRKVNLRVATKPENGANHSKRKGYYWDKQIKRWRAQLGHMGKHVSLGCYATEEEAAEAYKRGARECWGEFAK